MLYLLFKIISTATRIGVSNLKDAIEKVTLYKFENNINHILYDMYSNCTIIIDKCGCYY